ncbi:MAG TPA: hypothetical protein VGJ32_16770 [Solirubrobacteraceae bacterium]
MTCYGCGRRGDARGNTNDVAYSSALGQHVCLRCLARLAPSTFMPPPPPRPRAERKPDNIDRVLARLEAHGLPTEYGGPSVVGSCCPLCPPRLGPFGTGRIRMPMVVTITSTRVFYECASGCDEQDIAAALRRAPDRTVAA